MASALPEIDGDRAPVHAQHELGLDIVRQLYRPRLSGPSSCPLSVISYQLSAISRHSSFVVRRSSLVVRLLATDNGQRTTTRTRAASCASTRRGLPLPARRLL